jgi:hypothetical protein
VPEHEDDDPEHEYLLLYASLSTQNVVLLVQKFVQLRGVSVPAPAHTDPNKIYADNPPGVHAPRPLHVPSEPVLVHVPEHAVYPAVQSLLLIPDDMYEQSWLAPEQFWHNPHQSPVLFMSGGQVLLEPVQFSGRSHNAPVSILQTVDDGSLRSEVHV